MSLPTISGVGTLTADPELRFIPSGKAVANLRIATNSRKLNKETQQWEDGDTTYLRATIWGDAAENVAESLVQGSRIIFSGLLKQNDWEDKEGNKRTSMEVDLDECGPSLKWATAKVTKAGARAKAGASTGFGDGNDPAPW